MFEFQPDTFPARIWATDVLLGVGLVLPTAITCIYFLWAKGRLAQLSYAVGKAVQFALPIVWWWTLGKPFELGGFDPRGTTIGLVFGIVVGLVMILLFERFHALPAFRDALAAVRVKVDELGVSSAWQMVALGVFYSLNPFFGGGILLAVVRVCRADASHEPRMGDGYLQRWLYVASRCAIGNLLWLDVTVVLGLFVGRCGGRSVLGVGVRRERVTAGTLAESFVGRCGDFFHRISHRDSPTWGGI